MEFDSDILFYKMHGSGNDFVLIPFDQGLDINLKTMSKWAKTICTRKFSVGADGLIFLTKKGIKDPSASYKWHFYIPMDPGQRCVEMVPGALQDLHMSWGLHLLIIYLKQTQAQ